MLEDTESGYRAKIILLKDDGYTHSTTDKKNNQSSYDNIKENGYIALKKESMVCHIKKAQSQKQYKFDNNIEEKIVNIEHIFKSKIFWFGIFHMVITHSCGLCVT